MRPGRSRKLRSLAIGAAIAVGASLGVLAPAAVAAPPANDNFAERTQLGDELPVNLTESNAGATFQEGEFISTFGFASGHSVWWEWEAPRSELVSIGSCGSDFTTKLNVFTGDTFPPRPVAAVSGPECEAQKTFAAVAGTRYDIGVDGYSFYIPGGPRASGEGTIALRIAPLPPPPNDNFAAAAPLQQIIWAFPNGNRMLMGDAPGGYNWGATSEPGEPVHGGGGGASVWYRFIAPGAGAVSFGFAAGTEPFEPVIAVYRGSAVDALTPVAVSGAGLGASFEATAGEEFRIAVDGKAEAEGAPWMGDFNLLVNEMLPPGEGNSSGVAEYDAATTAPRVPKPISPVAPQVKGRTIDSRTGSATIRFGSATRGARFRCSLDRAPFHGCASPLHLRHLHPGAHRLGIVSVLRGRPASKPRVVRFKIAAAGRRPHQAG